MSKKKTHIDDLLEWNNHQYDPGHYTGSNTHPFIKADGNPRRVSIWYFFQAGVLALFYFLPVIQTIRGNASYSWGGKPLSLFGGIMFWSLLLGPLILLCTLLGVRYYQKGKRMKAERNKIVHHKKKKKRK